jgi:UDP-N-acetylglucosamine:LPS N-acetylglucosamine transferase
VRSLLDDPVRRESMSEAMLRAARPGAAAEIADELVSMAQQSAKWPE